MVKDIKKIIFICMIASLLIMQLNNNVFAQDDFDETVIEQEIEEENIESEELQVEDVQNFQEGFEDISDIGVQQDITDEKLEDNSLVDEQRFESNIQYVFDENGFIIEEINYENEVYVAASLRSRAMPTNFGIGFINFNNYSGKVINVYPSATGNNAYTYFNTGSGQNVACLGKEGNRIKVVINGYVGYIENNSAFRFLNTSSSELLEYYTVNSSNDFVYTYKYYGRSVSIVTGPAPSFANKNTKYFSVDGIYFYTSRSTMLNDYSANKNTSAVNKTPYFNYYQYLPIRSTTNLTATDFLNFLNSRINTSTNSVLKNSSNINEFFTSQNAYGVNAAMEFSMAMLESGYGTSNIALTKNNLFGWGAVDSGPYAGAYKFSSVADGIKYHADNGISSGYADSVSDSRYRGSNLGNKNVGINVLYASDPYWGMKISGLYYLMDKQAGFKDLNSNMIAVKKDLSEPNVYFEGKQVYKLKNNHNGFKIKYLPQLVVSTTKTNILVQSDVAICNPGDNADYPNIKNGVYSVTKFTCTSGMPFYPADYTFNKDRVSVSKSSMIFTGGNALTNDPIKASNIIISEVSSNQVTVTITGIDAPSGVNSIYTAVWTDQNGQDDLKWYTATKNSNGHYSFSFDIARHNNSSGKYNFHTYGKNSLNTENFIIQTTYNMKEKVTSDLAVSSPTNISKKVELSNLNSNTYKNVRINVWNNKIGKSKMKTYNLSLKNNKFETNINLVDFSFISGDYTIEAYALGPGNFSTFVNSTTFKYQKPSLLTVSTTSNSSGFNVSIKETTAFDIKTYRIAVWSEKSGQDDLKWYSITDSNKTNYNIDISRNNHKGDGGKYFVDVYAKLNNGDLIFVKSTTHNLTDTKAPGVYISNETEDTFKVTVITDSNYAIVKVPVWSAAFWQDDLHWYNAKKVSNNTYEVTVNIKNHNYSTGLFYVDVYGKKTTKSKNKYLFTKTVNVDTFSASSISSQLLQGSMRLSLNSLNAPHGVKSVKAAVWSNKNGQDDVKWYSASKSGKNYIANVNLSNHNLEIGTYTVHFYGYNKHGGFNFIKSTTFTVSKPTIDKNDVSVSNTSYNLNLTNVKSAMNFKTVKAAVWSVNGWQDDLKWFKMTKSNNNYSYKGNISNHKYDSGKYIIHYYGFDSKGKSTYIGQNTFNINEVSAQSVEILNLTNNSFEIVVRGVSNTATLDKIYVPTWSVASGQDDLEWYVATKRSDGTYRKTVYIKNHKYSYGEYIVHAYAKNKYNSKTFLKAATVSIGNISGKLDVRKSSSSKFTLTVSDLSGSNTLKEIYVPTWSAKNGQDDIRWYKATKQSDGTYAITVNTANHRFDKGMYIFHAYGKDNNGNLYYLDYKHVSN